MVLSVTSTYTVPAFFQCPYVYNVNSNDFYLFIYLFIYLFRTQSTIVVYVCMYVLLREDINPPRFLLNRVPEQITETNV